MSDLARNSRHRPAVCASTSNSGNCQQKTAIVAEKSEPADRCGSSWLCKWRSKPALEGTAGLPSQDAHADFAALDEALNRLGGVNLRKSQVVELRFFGGLSVEETAEVFKVSSDTVQREWKVAKLWLLRQLGGEACDGA